jgi:hypothetical protein
MGIAADFESICMGLDEEADIAAGAAGLGGPPGGARGGIDKAGAGGGSGIDEKLLTATGGALGTAATSAIAKPGA